MRSKKTVVVPAAKQRLTIAQVALYDDYCTDALVDHPHFWTKIRKNTMKFQPRRGITDQAVAEIIRKLVIIEKDVARAEAKLLELDVLKKYLATLKSAKEKEDFRRHLRKYINIYLPDCPFEVCTTNRYTIHTQEAKVTARRLIRKGEVIKYLCGVQVLMSPEEEETMQLSRRDFSIVISSRKKTPSIFLGPARFSNHDCNPNARLSTTGNVGMEVISVRDIDVGEEITVGYGDNYFGEDNCECLCESCEDACRNGWSQGDASETTPKPSIEEETDKGRTLRRRLRQSSESPSSINGSRNGSITPEVNIRPQIQKRTPSSMTRYRNAETPSDNSPALEPRSPNFNKRKRGSPLKNEKTIENVTEDESVQATKKLKTVESVKIEEPTQPPPVKRGRGRPRKSTLTTEQVDKRSPLKAEEVPMTLEEALSSHPTPVSSSGGSPPSSLSNAEEGNVSTDATSVDEDTIVVEQPSPMIGVIPTAKRTRGSRMSERLEQAKTAEAIVIGPSTTSQHPAVEIVEPSPDKADSVLPELGNADLDTSEQPVVASNTPSKTPTRNKKRSYEGDLTANSGESSKRSRKGKSLSPTPSTEAAIRVPGDYYLTPILIVEPHDAWTTCSICEESWVQKNKYVVEVGCPRCVRHWNLYGYVWPKTDKEGRDDSEERNLDPRTAHNHVDPKIVKANRLKNRGASASPAGSRAMTREITEPAPSKEEVEKVPVARSRRGRPVKRPRKTI